jgi:hypothetical protein
MILVYLSVQAGAELIAFNKKEIKQDILLKNLFI